MKTAETIKQEIEKLDVAIFEIFEKIKIAMHIEREAERKATIKQYTEVKDLLQFKKETLLWVLK